MGNLTTTTEVAATNEFLGLDLLSDLRTAPFFRLREALAHYNSLRSELAAEFNDEVIEAIQAVLALPKKDRHAIWSAFVPGSASPGRSPPTQPESPGRTLPPTQRRLARVSGADRFFFPLDVADLTALKGAYRRAVKACHPDAGGSHDSMVALNLAFDALHAIVSVEPPLDLEDTGSAEERESLRPRWEIADLPEEPSWTHWLTPTTARMAAWYEVKQPRDADGVLELRLVAALIDDLLLEEAADRLVGFLPSAPRLKWFPDWWAERPVQALCVGLRAAGRDEGARTVADALMATAEALAEKGRNWRRSEWGRRTRIVVEQAMSKARPTVRPIHPRQAENWARLTGGVPSMAARAIEIRAEVKDNSLARTMERIGGFMPLPGDPPPPARLPPDSARIPQPTGAEPLTAEQAAEYHKAFFSVPDRHLIGKYLDMRWLSWFHGLFADGVDREGLLREIVAVADEMPVRLKRTPKRRRIDGISPECTFLDFADYLADLPAGEREHRLRLLDAIETRYAETHLRPGAMVVGLTPGGARAWVSDGMGEGSELLTINPILLKRPRARWYVGAQAPVEQLEHALETGWLLPEQEARRRYLARNADYNRAMEVFLALGGEYGPQERDPGCDDEAFVRKAATLIDGCLRHADRTEFVEEWRFGWWFAELMASLDRLSRTQEADGRVRQFFSLPPRFWGRATEKEMKKLVSRAKRIGLPIPSLAIE